jgi:uncharacterized BrkB/YihY/UPF0761 family membrane protein
MDVSAVRPRSLARMTHLARRAAAACHQDRVDGLAAEFAFFGVLSTFPGLLVVAALVGLSGRGRWNWLRRPPAPTACSAPSAAS